MAFAWPQSVGECTNPNCAVLYFGTHNPMQSVDHCPSCQYLCRRATQYMWLLSMIAGETLKDPHRQGAMA